MIEKRGHQKFTKYKKLILSLFLLANEKLKPIKIFNTFQLLIIMLNSLVVLLFRKNLNILKIS